MRRFVKLAVLGLLLILLSGCGAKLPDFDLQFTLDPQELYTLPKLPAKYTELNDQIKQIIRSGAEYAAPLAGTNIQPVQLRDLDGDGREEAVAFFRAAAEDKPLRICIYAADGETYRQTAVIEGSGTAIYSVTYRDLDNDGHTELLVGWRVSPELQVLAVYALRANGPVELLRTDYVKYSAQDLDQNRMQELVVLRSVPDTGDSVADYYDWRAGTLEIRSSARVSMTMAELNQQGQLTSGTLRGGEAAVFVTGVVDSTQTITDILALRNGEFSNLVLSDATGVSGETALFRSLYPMDINGDGITEVPRPEFLAAWDNSNDFHQRISWNSYDMEGVAETATSTYHNLEDGWYFQLPETWFDRILVSRNVASDEATVTFYIRENEEGVPEPFLRVVAIGGTSRENKAVRGSRFILSRKTETIYVAELLDGNAGWEYGMNEDEVRAAFNLIATEWADSET